MITCHISCPHHTAGLQNCFGVPGGSGERPVLLPFVQWSALLLLLPPALLLAAFLTCPGPMRTTGTPKHLSAAACAEWVGSLAPEQQPHKPFGAWRRQPLSN